MKRLVAAITVPLLFLSCNPSGVPSIATDLPTAVTIGSGYVYRAGGTDVAVADGGTGSSNGSITGIGALAFAAGGANNNVTPSLTILEPPSENRS